MSSETIRFMAVAPLQESFWPLLRQTSRPANQVATPIIGKSGEIREINGVGFQLSKVLIFDEAISNLEQQTAEHFAQTIRRIKGQVTMVFITHQVPKGLQVDEVVNMGQQGVHMSLVKEET